VYRSLQNIFVQIIDDTTGNTLVSASTIEKGAIRNEKLIILSAGTPIASILSDASNIFKI